MSGRKLFIIFLGMIALGLTAFYLIRLGAYPVAIVGASAVSARDLEQTVIAAHRYYSQSLKTYSLDRGDDVLNEHATIFELRRAALDRLIEDKIVYRELQVRLGRGMDGAVDKKIEGLNLKSGFEDAVSALYGITLAEFRKMVLAPKARAEILEGRVFAEGSSDFSEWLQNIKKSAKIIILAPDLMWDGEKVAAK